jgi:hypothetical protein
VTPSSGARDRAVPDAVQRAARLIVGTVFRDRTVRVSYSEKRTDERFGPRLVTSYVIAPDERNHIHNYPLSIAGWALAEARIIAWPMERTEQCDFDRLARLGKLEELDRLVADDRLIKAPPFLDRAVDTPVLQNAFARRSLRLGDFYQDWDEWAPATRYSQFISVPAPVLSVAQQDTSRPEEYGVFNIDTLNDEPLLNDITGPRLAVAANEVALVYESNRQT